MFWLGKKMFAMRQQLSVKRKLIPEDEEKPFLEHLEDLRKSLTRIIATLLIGMVTCFVFKEQIFELVKRPITAADIGVMDKEQSPLGLKDPKEWPQVTSIAYGLLGLNEAQRGVFLSHAFKPETEHLRPVVDALLLRHAAQNLPKELKEAYLHTASGGNQTLLGILRDMEHKKVDASFERGPKHMNLRFFKPGEGFNLSMKLSLYAGIVVGFPLLLYFLLEFIVPGLRPEERRVLWPSLAVGFGLFLVGVLFAYFVVTPNALRFLYNYDLSLGGTTEYRFTDYASFVVSFTLIFGLCFELPVIVYALNKLGILSYELMKNTRSYAIIVIVIVAALLTPTTDLVNLSLLAVPMVFLYEMSIWIAYFHDKAVRKREIAEEAADQAARDARRQRAAMAGAYLDAPAEHSSHGDTLAPTEQSPPFCAESYSLDHPATDANDSASAPAAVADPGTGGEAPPAGEHPQDESFGRLTGQPTSEAASYGDRAETWPPDTVEQSGAEEPPATRPAPETPGEPSEERRRHSD